MAPRHRAHPARRTRWALARYALALVVLAAAVTALVLVVNRPTRHPSATRPAPEPQSSAHSVPPPLRSVPFLGSGNCAASPHTCGYPDATDTGVPSGMKLKSVPGQVSHGRGWYFDPHGWVEVYQPGTVLQGLSIPYNVDVSASDVTIKDVRITVIGNSFGVSLRHTSDVTIEDSDISSPYSGPNRLMVGIKDIYGNCTGTRVLRDNIWHTATGVQIYAGLIADNYIHSPGFRPGDHTNGITTNGDLTDLTIVHNTVLVDRGQTDAIGLFPDFGAVANVTVADNLLAGGGYTVYGGDRIGDPQAYNIRIIDNRISRIYFPMGGYYGYAADFDPQARGDVWSGNVWDGSGQEISAPSLTG